MQKVKVVLWRHAPTAENFSGTLQGRSDTDTNEHGLELGRQAARTLLNLYGKPAAVFTSPLKRASATAALLAEQDASIPVRIEQGITQRSYGVWEGMNLSDVARLYPDELKVRDAGGDPNIPGWERGIDVGRRVAATIRQHTEITYGSATDVTPVLVFVSHGSAIATGVRTLLNLPESPQLLGHLQHTNWVELDYSKQAWKLTRYNYGLH
ncbi:histidine phosphatase family protein [Timonella sp. A28]|uniref:histidine phosphatase family protein n=1 Tax=Timonella sp. A28 TaxID=3442640 RepID=UPI003EB7681A